MALHPQLSDGLKNLCVIKIFLSFFSPWVELTLPPAFSITAEAGRPCDCRLTHILCARELPVAGWACPSPRPVTSRETVRFSVFRERLFPGRSVFVLRPSEICGCRALSVNPLAFLLTRSRAFCAASAVGEGQAFLCPQGSHSWAQHQIDLRQRGE